MTLITTEKPNTMQCLFDILGIHFADHKGISITLIINEEIKQKSDDFCRPLTNENSTNSMIGSVCTNGIV